MGIRIHKVLGYGFKQVRLDRDPRFNPHAFYSMDQAAHEERFGSDKDLLPHLVAFLEHKAPSVASDLQWVYRLEIDSLREQLGKKLTPLYYHDVVMYSPCTIEKKPPIGPLVFTVPYQKWCRFDDPVDYYEDTQRNVRADGGPEDKCSIIVDCEGQPSGLYPNNGSYIHRVTGEFDKQLCTVSRWEITRILRKQGQPNLKPGNPFGVKTLVEWQRHIVPEVPLFIRAFCECFQIFKEERMIQRLRPMLYTYWS